MCPVFLRNTGQQSHPLSVRPAPNGCLHMSEPFNIKLSPRINCTIMSSHCIKKNTQETSHSTWCTPETDRATGENFGQHIKERCRDDCRPTRLQLSSIIGIAIVKCALSQAAYAVRRERHRHPHTHTHTHTHTNTHTDIRSCGSTVLCWSLVAFSVS
jgi:hypothetical protein